MKGLLIGLLLFAAVPILAQPSITGTVPSNLSTNVALQTTIKIAFSAPLDTTKAFTQFTGYITSIDTVVGQWYSANRDTLFMNVRLAPSHSYFIVFYWAPGQGSFATPYGIQFTTGSSFTGTTVSGTVTSASLGVTGAGAVVGLSDRPIAGQGPHFVAGTISNGSGNFTIPYVPNGTLYPVAAKDVNGDGNIDPNSGDAVGITSSLNVTGSPITGISLVLSVGTPLEYHTALDSANTYQGANLPGALLRRVSCWQTDSAGTGAGNWSFFYFTPTGGLVTEVRVESFATTAKPGDYWTSTSIPYLRNLTNPGSAASSTVFVTNCENGGGYAYRTQSVPPNWVFTRTIQLGQLTYSNIPWQYVPDSTAMYWMAQYHFDIVYTQDSSTTQQSMWFIGDFSTGAIISTASVDPSAQVLPRSFSLEQNYPNPFNPSTTIAYNLPVQSSVTLDVYNLLGQKVTTLVNGELSAGQHEALWKANVASGIYLYKLTAVSNSDQSRVFTQVRKMVLMK